ncbi:hypothetical protein C8R44DRAFT_726522 [Mycena epipterygia]|nr:hypothetical protein C8R44DRAFT_726522 [Mycena epipterygia]
MRRARLGVLCGLYYDRPMLRTSIPGEQPVEPGYHISSGPTLSFPQLVWLPRQRKQCRYFTEQSSTIVSSMNCLGFKATQAIWLYTLSGCNSPGQTEIAAGRSLAAVLEEAQSTSAFTVPHGLRSSARGCTCSRGDAHNSHELTEIAKCKGSICGSGLRRSTRSSQVLCNCVLTGDVMTVLAHLAFVAVHGFRTWREESQERKSELIDRAEHRLVVASGRLTSTMGQPYIHMYLHDLETLASAQDVGPKGSATEVESYGGRKHRRDEGLESRRDEASDPISTMVSTSSRCSRSATE